MTNVLYLTATLTKDPEMKNNLCILHTKTIERGRTIYITFVAAGPIRLAAMKHLKAGMTILAKASVYTKFNEKLQESYYMMLLEKFSTTYNKDINLGKASGKIVYMNQTASRTQVVVDTGDGKPNCLGFVARRNGAKDGLNGFKKGDSIVLNYKLHAHIQKRGAHPGYKRNLQITNVEALA